MRDLVAELRKAAAEIAKAGHGGWGNTCSDAADAIAALQSERPAIARMWHDRLGSMIDQVGHPDYSLRELVAGLREIRDEMLAASPTNEGERK